MVRRYQYDDDEDGFPFVAYALFSLLSKLNVSVKKVHLAGMWMTGSVLTIEYNT